MKKIRIERRTSEDSGGRLLRLTSASWTAALLGGISFVLLFGWTGYYPLAAVPLLVGVLVGLLCSSPLEALIVGAVAGGAGIVCASFIYRFKSFVAYMKRTGSYLSGGLWRDTIVPLIRSNPVNVHGLWRILVVVVGTLLTAGVSMAVAWAAPKLGSVVDRRWLGLGFLALLGVSLGLTLFVTNSSFVLSISKEPAPKTYAFDGTINLKTYYLMRHGENYYDAIINAAAGDKRFTTIRDGRWNGAWGMVSPTHVREPWIFYFWVGVGYFGASGILWASLLIAIGMLMIWYWALFPRLGQSALILGPVLLPLLFVHMSWLNLVFPDWWASLLLTYSAALMVMRRFVAAGVFGLLAALGREVLALYLLVVIAVGVVLWLLKKARLGEIVPFVGAFAIFVVAYAYHYLRELPYLGPSPKEQTVSTLLVSRSHDLLVRVVGPTSYLMFPYGDGFVPAVLLIVVGAIGLFVMLKGSEYARYAVVGYLVAMLAFFAVVGAASSSNYWGQDITPLGLIGCAALLAGIHRFSDTEEPAAETS